ncbi:MAG: terminase [Magnetococcales bacterium]|nr:terminase [Magnetococcales bacterium]MBF0116945.1 terminase [Magnetococcales bacterium]
MSIKQNMTNLPVMRQRQGRKAAPGLSVKRRELFLDGLARTGTVTDAARLAGVSRGGVYLVRSADPSFAERWEDALLQYVDSLEFEAFRRGVEGVEEPVFQGGQLVGHIRKYSDSLLLALLRAKRPEYRPTTQAQVAVVAPAPKERDPVRLARKIAFALAIAAKSEKGANVTS